MTIEHWDAEVDGTLTAAALQEKLAQRGYSCSTCHYPPGTRFPPHTHDVDKIDGVLEGRFRIGMGGSEYLLGPGDIIAVPAGREHTAEVVGDETVISIDAVKARS